MYLLTYWTSGRSVQKTRQTSHKHSRTCLRDSMWKLSESLHWRHRTQFWSLHEDTPEWSGITRRKKIHQKYRKQSQSEQNITAFTQHINTLIDWDEATVIGCEPDWTTRWIREAVKIDRKTKMLSTEVRAISWAMSMLTYLSQWL